MCRILPLLLCSLAFAGCVNKKGDPEQTPTYIEALKAKTPQERIDAVENLVRVGAAALPALEKEYRAGYGALAKLLIEQLKGSRKGSMLEIQLVASEQMQTDEWHRRRVEKEAYRVPAGHEWAPVDLRLQPRFGGRSGALLIVGQRRWTDRTLRKLSLSSDGSQVMFSMQTPLVQPFGTFTGANAGKRLAFRLRGIVVSAPVIQGKMEGAGVVSGLNEHEVALVLGVYRASQP